MVSQTYGIVLNSGIIIKFRTLFKGSRSIHFDNILDLGLDQITIQAKHYAYLRLTAGDEWGVTLGVTEGVTEGVDWFDVVHLSSLKSPLGILNFCKNRKKAMKHKYSLFQRVT